MHVAHYVNGKQPWRHPPPPSQDCGGPGGHRLPPDDARASPSGEFRNGIRRMTHWRNGKLPPESRESDEQLVKVVDKLPKVPPSQIVFLRYDPDDRSGGTYWRWNGHGWEPDKLGTTLPSNRVE